MESSGIALVDKMLQFLPNQLRVRLLQEKVLSIEELVRQVNSYEASRSANDQISGNANNTRPANNQASDNINYIVAPCGCCGLSHNRRTCPARDKTCAKCGKRGHFAGVCRSTSFAAKSEHFNQNAFKRSHGNTESLNTGPATKRKFSRQIQKIHALEYEEKETNTELVEMVSSKNDSDG